MPAITRAAAFIAAYLLANAYALSRGGKQERWAVAILTAGMLLTWALIHPFKSRFHGPEIGVALADALTLGGLIWLAITADRYWPLWIAAMQATVVLCHLGMILKPFTLPTYYKNTIQLWIYPQLALLVAGTLRHRLRTEPSPLEAWVGRLAGRRHAGKHTGDDG